MIENDEQRIEEYEAWNLATHWSDVRYHVKQLENKVGWGPWVEILGYSMTRQADIDFRKLREYLVHSSTDNGNLLALVSGTIRDICDITDLDEQDYLV